MCGQEKKGSGKVEYFQSVRGLDIGIYGIKIASIYGD
jgi:hypothetical protein